MLKFVYHITEACAVSGLGRTRLYEEIACGRLDARKLGSKTVITAGWTMTYPPDFQSWPLERRNAWFGDEAAAYRESQRKANGNGATDHAGPVAMLIAEVGPTPLASPSKPLASYPINALGDVLVDAARAIAAKVQCADAMAAQSVFAVASLAAQALADVRLPYGQTRPLSLFCLTIASSGDRKTSADSEAMAPVRIREKIMPLRSRHGVANANKLNARRRTSKPGALNCKPLGRNPRRQSSPF